MARFVSRVPVDLLARWRCGLKIAVTWLATQRWRAQTCTLRLRRAMNGLFGLGRVITRSWELLGVSQGAAEAQAADIVVRPHTHLLSGHDFGAIESFISEGRTAAERSFLIF